jgi:hypothetical protein
VAATAWGEAEVHVVIEQARPWDGGLRACPGVEVIHSQCAVDSLDIG